MRAILFVVCAACGASIAQPAVIPNLSQLPEDGQTRDAVIDGSFAQPGPEQQPTTKRGRKIETTAATAAAILGMWFSKTENVTLGLRMEENDVVHHEAAQPPAGKGSGDGQATGDAAADGKAAGQLLPWIHIAPPDAAK